MTQTTVIFVLVLSIFTFQRDCNTLSEKLTGRQRLLNKHAKEQGVKRFLVNQQSTDTKLGAQWSDWGEWSPCRFAGDRYIIERYRKCDNPPPSLFGRDCDGAPIEMHMCELGSWGTWTAWFPCSCDKTHTRTRQCNSTMSGVFTVTCVGTDTDIKPCVPNPANNCPINGGWSMWSSWLPCNVSCGQGTASRLRLCSNPTPKNGGSHCEGSSVDSQPCTQPACTM